MIIGYARTSTIEQIAGLENQVEKLVSAGCEVVYSEQVSAVSSSRNEWQKAIDSLREGDVLVATTLSRVSRSVRDLGDLLDIIEARNASLRILDMNLDTSTATGRLVLSVMNSINTFERELMLERQKVGIAAAKKAGKYKGRAPTVRSKSDAIMAMVAAGHKVKDISKTLGVSLASTYRIINEQRQQTEKS